MTKEYKSFIYTGNKKSCSGCGACSQICKHAAITMEPDEEGFLFPKVNKDKCVNCGLCDLICPAVGNNQANQEQRQHCYIATTKQKEYYKESASIGICTMLADYIVSQGGVVYGCYLDENDWTAYHIGVSDNEGLQRLRNSKYLQSNTKQTFTEVKASLVEGKLILYIGTPCQIAGLKAFLRKDYSNLITVDIICHGVFSPRLMPLEISYWEKLFNSKVYNFRFRSKRKYTHTNCGMVNFDIVNKYGKLKHIERHASSSPTYHCFAYSSDGENYNLRPSCYKCPMRDVNRYGDITVGDPWKIESKYRRMLGGNQLLQSIYSCNTQKGLEIMSHIQTKLSFLEFSSKELFCQDAVLPTNRKCPIKRKQLFAEVEVSDYGNLIETIFETNLERNHRIFQRNYMINRIKTLIKNVLLKFYLLK